MDQFIQKKLSSGLKNTVTEINIDQIAAKPILDILE